MEIEIIFKLDDEIIDIEWCSIHGHTPPKDRKYRIIIDKVKYVVHQECLTGSEILKLAGKESSQFHLREKMRDGTITTIAPDQKVCFTKCGIEKFKTLPIDQTDGELRKDFNLFEEDEQYLNALKLPWEAVNTTGGKWVFIHNYPIPTGYNVEEATISVQISPNYPTTQLDMVCFHPPLSRVDSVPIAATSDLPLEGKTFQQWSRHRTPQNPWRAGEDSLSTHIPLAEVWLMREFQKTPLHAISA